MKVLINNYEPYKTVEAKKFEDYPRRHICESCKSELEYEKSDLRIGEFGLVILDCPCCGYDNVLDDNENAIILTKDNVVFPNHFYHASEKNRAVNCCTNENIKESINKAINFFRKNKDESVWMTAFGNLHVTVFRYDGDEVYNVIVTNDYYSTEIPFEVEDYKVVNF